MLFLRQYNLWVDISERDEDAHLSGGTRIRIEAAALLMESFEQSVTVHTPPPGAVVLGKFPLWEDLADCHTCSAPDHFRAYAPAPAILFTRRTSDARCGPSAQPLASCSAFSFLRFFFRYITPHFLPLYPCRSSHSPFVSHFLVLCPCLITLRSLDLSSSSSSPLSSTQDPWTNRNTSSRSTTHEGFR